MMAGAFLVVGGFVGLVLRRNREVADPDSRAEDQTPEPEQK
jgi:hypothetical protein